MMQDGYSSMLTTPIKKIRELSIHSPDDDAGAGSSSYFSSVNRNNNKEYNLKPEALAFSRQESMSPIRYPSMSDFTVKPVPLEQISQSMLDRGYSRTLSNKVLRELDNRANEISRQVSTGQSATTRPSSAKLKRYSQFHKPVFKKMESISSHYAATRSSSINQSNELLSSASKKRRTLNGPEEIFAVEKENESPTRRKESKTNGTANLSTPFMGAVPTLTADLTSEATPLMSSPYRDMDASPYISSAAQISPTRTLDPGSQSSSPTKFTRISPSKGSMNLKGLLLDDFEFAKPAGPVKIRQSSLQMAGVVPSTGLNGIPSLQKKASTSSLQKKSSMSSLQSSSSSKLQNKPSIGNLQRGSLTSLQSKNSINSTFGSALSTKSKIETSRVHTDHAPSLQKKPLTSLLQNRNNVVPKVASPMLNKKTLQTGLGRFSQTLSVCQASPKSSSARHVYNNIPSSTSQRTLASQNSRLLDPSMNQLPSSQSILSIRSNVTTPKPFSLYYKPTVSSSQKSFGAMQSSASLRSLALSLNLRNSANKYH